MHPVRRQRLWVVLSIVIFSTAAIGLVVYALRGNINLFYPPMELYAPFYPAYPGHPSPSSLPPYYGPPPWLYEWDPQHREDQQRLHRREERRRAKERELRKRSRSKSSGPRESSGGHKSKRQKGPTDSDIEKSYTGMDRDLAEEFIEQTMDPAILIDQTMSGTESEAW